MKLANGNVSDSEGKKYTSFRAVDSFHFMDLKRIFLSRRVLNFFYSLSTISRYSLLLIATAKNGMITLVGANESINLLTLAAIMAKGICAMNIGKVIIPLNLRSSLQEMPACNRIQRSS